MNTKNLYGCIYTITNKVNNKQYIGQTKAKKPKNRFNSHVYEANTENPSMLISRAIKKYGRDNFNFEIVYYLTENENLTEIEGIYINKYNSLHPNGYNLKEIDNSNHVHSKETKDKISKIKKQKKYIEISSVNGKKSRGRKFELSSSKFVGVIKDGCRYKAYINNKKKTKWIGSFLNEVDAAIARDIAEIQHNKSSTVLNFPENISKYLNNDIFIQKVIPNTIIPSNKKSPSSVVGVHYDNTRKKWVFERKGFKFKSFKTQKDAEQHAINQYS